MNDRKQYQAHQIRPIMAFYQAAAPESPRPFSVISEQHQRTVVLPNFPQHAIYSFGAEYEEKLVKLIHRFLELGTDDRFCYVGDIKGSVASLIQERFCLLDPVLHVVPGKDINLEEKGTSQIPVAYCGAEEYFKGVAQNPENMPLFDRVLMKDCVQDFTNPKKVYQDIMRTISPMGKLMIIQRPHNVNTLPLFTDAKRRFAETEDPYISIIKDLQNCGYDIEWDVECVPIMMQKTKWLKMMEERFPSQLSIMGGKEIKNGLRELSEGILKYQGEMMEFQDRLLFVTASRPLIATGTSEMSRIDKDKQQKKTGDDLRYNMRVTNDMEQYIPKSNVRPRISQHR